MKNALVLRREINRGPRCRASEPTVCHAGRVTVNLLIMLVLRASRGIHFGARLTSCGMPSSRNRTPVNRRLRHTCAPRPPHWTESGRQWFRQIAATHVESRSVRDIQSPANAASAGACHRTYGLRLTVRVPAGRGTWIRQSGPRAPCADPAQHDAADHPVVQRDERDGSQWLAHCRLRWPGGGTRTRCRRGEMGGADHQPAVTPVEAGRQGRAADPHRRSGRPGVRP